ncbi:hypothetical protein EMB92_08265 [Bifidobacterium callitrichos]|uniref:Lactococcin 972 family bacteriocin n=1 Tax=Bifidobacterium callitrichos TaxID=762209 RepID=A0A5M9ZBW7_9BIFI|nr:lactococcin 972 family bacteriocin [Bifidobacterium callitrichos]KAA8815930.1 hypothetical protein EMB92_08265 [Bifidobacterium callitrichos]
MSIIEDKASRIKKLAVVLLTCVSMTFIPVASASAAELDVIVPTSENGEYEIQPLWLNPEGKHTQYPAQGGVWEWGFWNVKIRSYYTHSTRVHGSSVSLNGSTVRSIDTARGKRSIAEKYAVNYWGNNDAYYYRVL